MAALEQLYSAVPPRHWEGGSTKSLGSPGRLRFEILWEILPVGKGLGLRIVQLQHLCQSRKPASEAIKTHLAGLFRASPCCHKETPEELLEAPISHRAVANPRGFQKASRSHDLQSQERESHLIMFSS